MALVLSHSADDCVGEATMASGVAATKLEKFHLTNWPNQNCDILVTLDSWLPWLTVCKMLLHWLCNSAC